MIDITDLNGDVHSINPKFVTGISPEHPGITKYRYIYVANYPGAIAAPVEETEKVKRYFSAV